MVVDFKWNLKSGSPNTWNPGEWLPFFKNHLKSGQKCPDFQWSTFHKVAKTKADLLQSRSFQIQPSKSPDFKYFPILNGWISDPGCILLLWRKLKKRFRLFVILCRFVQPWTERWRDANQHSRANTTTWSTRYFHNMVNQVFSQHGQPGILASRPNKSSIQWGHTERPKTESIRKLNIRKPNFKMAALA